jgi:hypothetical protein
MNPYRPAVAPDFTAVDTTVLADVIGALLTIVLIAGVAALIMSAVTWAWGSHSGNYNAATRGRIGSLIALGTSAAAGAGVAWCNFLIGIGGTL